MERNYLPIVALFAAFSLMALAYSVSNQDVYLAPSGTSQARAQVVNLAPNVNIQTVSPDPLVFLPRTNEQISVEFRAQDANGLSNLDDTTAFAELDFTSTLPTEPIRTNTGQCTSTDQGNQRFYTCLIDLEYYAAPGVWSLRVGVSDIDASSPLSGEDTDTYTIPLSKHITLNPGSPGAEINFPPLTPGGINFLTTSPTAIQNDGNYEGEIQVSASNLTGEQDPAFYIPAENFNAGGSIASDVCIVNPATDGTPLSDIATVNVQTSFLSRGPSGSDLETISYCLTSVPATLSSQFYSTQATGVPWTIGI